VDGKAAPVESDMGNPDAELAPQDADSAGGDRGDAWLQDADDVLSSPAWVAVHSNEE
jgi:hypothetical protein